MDWQVFTGLLAYEQTTHVASMAAFDHGRATAKTAGHRAPAICQKRHKSRHFKDLHSKQNSRHTVCVSPTRVASGCQSVRPETALIVRACRDCQICVQSIASWQCNLQGLEGGLSVNLSDRQRGTALDGRCRPVSAGVGWCALCDETRVGCWFRRAWLFVGLRVRASGSADSLIKN